MQKVHFLRLAYNFSYLNTSKTHLKCSIWSSQVLMYTSMSSKYTTTNLPKNARNTCFIILIKVLGAFVSPKGITNHSYNPYLVWKAVFHSSPSWILIWWYPLWRSIWLKIQKPCNSSSISSSLGMGCRYFIVILLTALQSTHILQVPSFFGTSQTGTARGLLGLEANLGFSVVQKK